MVPDHTAPNARGPSAAALSQACPPARKTAAATLRRCCLAMGLCAALAVQDAMADSITGLIGGAMSGFGVDATPAAAGNDDSGSNAFRLLGGGFFLFGSDEADPMRGSAGGLTVAGLFFRFSQPSTIDISRFTGPSALPEHPWDIISRAMSFISSRGAMVDLFCVFHGVFDIDKGTRGGSDYHNPSPPPDDIDIGPVVPIPAALPLFASAAGLLGLVGWRRRSTRTRRQVA